MNAQASLFDTAPLDNFEPVSAPIENANAWRDYDCDPVPHLRHLPIREQLKRCMARFVYAHRHEMPPNSVDVVDEYRRITWSEWWQQRFGQSLDDYELQIKQTAAAAASTKG